MASILGGTKVCTLCQQSLHFDNFSVSPNGDGRMAMCKPCRKSRYYTPVAQQLESEVVKLMRCMRCKEHKPRSSFDMGLKQLKRVCRVCCIAPLGLPELPPGVPPLPTLPWTMPPLNLPLPGLPELPSLPPR